MSTEHLPLPEGQSVTLATRLTWGQQGAINRAIETGSAQGFVEAAAKALTLSANLRDVEGQALPPVPSDLEERMTWPDWDRLDGHIGDAIARRAVAIWREWRKQRDPKGTATPSDDSPSA